MTENLDLTTAAMRLESKIVKQITSAEEAWGSYQVLRVQVIAPRNDRQHRIESDLEAAKIALDDETEKIRQLRSEIDEFSRQQTTDPEDDAPVRQILDNARSQVDSWLNSREDAPSRSWWSRVRSWFGVR